MVEAWIIGEGTGNGRTQNHTATGKSGARNTYLNQFGILAPVKEGVNAKRISLFKLTHCLSMVNDYLVICLMPTINPDQKLALLKAVTGWNTGWVEMLQVAERILTTMRMFNIR